MKRLLLTPILALILLAAGCQEPRYRLAKVERGPIAARVAASGTVNAVRAVQVGSPIPGQVKEIYADFNTPVKKGQVIARLEPAAFELRVDQARADLDAAREQLNAVQAQTNVNAAQVASARAALKQREALLQQAQADLERTVIRAPVDGTVILRNQAPLSFTIAQDLHEVQVEAPIAEADAARLQSGMAATFSVEAFPRHTFSGEVREIRKSRHTVVIAAANPELALLPGMTAHVRVTVESRPSVLKVPNAALRWRPATGSERVWVLERGAPKAIVVRAGITDGTSTELVQSPLAEDAQVIVGQ